MRLDQDNRMAISLSDLDIEAARAIFGSVLFAASFHERIVPWSSSRERFATRQSKIRRGGFSLPMTYAEHETKLKAPRVRAAASPGLPIGETSWFARAAHLLRAMSSEAFSPTLPPTATATRPSRCSNAVPQRADVSMRIQSANEISSIRRFLRYIHEQRTGSRK